MSGVDPLELARIAVRVERATGNAALSEPIAEAADELGRLQRENARLYKMAYLEIPIPKFLRRKQRCAS